MPSPFPGMDPYLEESWNGVHVFMMAAIAARLNKSLPAGLRARPEESVRVESVIAGGQPVAYGYRADVAVAPEGRPAAAAAAVLTPAEPVLVPYERGTVVDRSVQIIDVDLGGRLVTVVEVLSPRNKR